MDGNRPTGAEEARLEPVAEQARAGEIVDLPGDHRSYEQGVDQIVGVIDAEDDRAARRHALGIPRVDRLEEEPEPEARKCPDYRVEKIGRSELTFGGEGHHRARN